MVEQFHNLSSLILTLFWIIAYLLMIRRGVLDKSYGIPMIALCLNVSWEFYFTFLTNIQMTYRMANGLFFIFDLGVLYTCYRYGREDFDWPILKQHFLTFLTASLALSLVGVYAFVTAFGDTYGGLFAAINTPLYSALLIAMLLRRNSVKGQSLYIGLAILIGDAAGYLPTHFAQQQGQVDVPPAWISTYYAYTLLLNAVYVGIYWYVARRDGINPWKRL
jgi:hypothetical protein